MTLQEESQPVVRRHGDGAAEVDTTERERRLTDCLAVSFYSCVGRCYSRYCCCCDLPWWCRDTEVGAIVPKLYLSNSLGRSQREDVRDDDMLLLPMIIFTYFHGSYDFFLTCRHTLG